MGIYTQRDLYLWGFFNPGDFYSWRSLLVGISTCKKWLWRLLIEECNKVPMICFTFSKGFKSWATTLFVHPSVCLLVRWCACNHYNKGDWYRIQRCSVPIYALRGCSRGGPRLACQLVVWLLLHLTFYFHAQNALQRIRTMKNKSKIFHLENEKELTKNESVCFKIAYFTSLW